MNLVNADTGEVVDIADAAEAERLASAIDVTLARVNIATGELVERVANALHRRAWVALGLGSWDDLVAARGWEFAPATSTERAALAKVMRESGMSFRAIGRLVGSSHQTAANDVRELSNSGQLDEPETVAGRDGKERPARRPRPVTEPDDLDEPDPEPFTDDRTNLLSYRVEFIKALAKAQQVCSFEPERVAASADLDGHGALLVWDAVDRLTIFLSKWIEDLESHRPRGLRVVNGDKR